jgi:hypothetical protein
MKGRMVRLKADTTDDIFGSVRLQPDQPVKRRNSRAGLNYIGADTDSKGEAPGWFS